MDGMVKWWYFLVWGILAVAFGIIALVWPAATVWVLVILFGCYALVEGLFTVGYSIALATRKEKFFALMMLGLLGVVIGLIALFFTAATTVAILVLIAIWAIIRGFLLVVSAFEIVAKASLRWLIGIIGALTVIVGLLFLIFPISGIFTILVIIAIYAILAGILSVITAFSVKKVEKTAEVAA